MTTQKSLETSKIAQSNLKNSLKPKKNQDKQIIIVEEKKLTETKLRMIEQTAQKIILAQFNVSEAARKIGVSSRAMYKRLQTYPEIQELIDKYNRTTLELAKRNIESSSLSASKKLSDLMNTSQNERLQLDSATQILDRSGIVKPPTNIKVNVLNDLRKDKETYDL